ncbi:MAG: response regulator [Ghiorsea sp.]
MKTPLQYSELLQEALLKIDQTAQSEHRLREESDAILQGLSSLVSASNQDDVLLALRSTFQRLIKCHDCWVMYEHKGKLISDVSDISFSIGKGFNRVINGGVLNAFDVYQVPEWADVNKQGIISALHLPLQLSNTRGMLVLTASTQAAFSHESINLAQRVIPFTEQAMAKLEYLEQKHIKELEKAYNLLESLINSIPDFIFYKDKNSVYLGCNDAFCQLIGKKSASEVIGVTDFDIFDKALAELFRKNDSMMLDKREPKRIEEWVTHADGRKMLLDTLKTPYYNDKGEIIGLIGMSRDITAYKALEVQFHQAQKMESIGTLVGGIAHEFNNTLAAIVGRLYLAKNGSLNNINVMRHLDNISLLSDRAAEMIQQLLAFSRKGSVQKKVFDLQGFLKETFKLHKFSISENITIETHFSDEVLPIHGDCTQLQQILINLLHNARDAVENVKSPRITITMETYEADHSFSQLHKCLEGEYFGHLTVEDNGSGISKQDKEKVFEPFFTTKEVGKGTGLGLSMAYGAIQTHHGFVDIDSELNQGTSMHIYVPLSDERHLADKKSNQTQLKLGGGECILLVDDEAEIRKTGCEVLESLGYKVLVASNGIEAVATFIDHKDTIDLTLLDVVMPDMSGFEASISIKSHRPDAKIIFCTGYDKEHVLEGKSIGNASVITKPYRIEELSKTIKETLHSPK